MNNMIEKFRTIFRAIIDLVLALNGNNFEDAEMILENALDLALSDKRDEIYR